MNGGSGSELMKRRRAADTKQKAWTFIRQLNETAGTQPDRIALEDGTRQFSYREMYRCWERYAAVFTALGMTEKEQARVGLLGATASETIFAFYGLDMVGAGISIIPSYSAFNPKKILRVIEEEHLTDIIITDDFAQADLIYRLLSQKKQLGLNNVLLLHVPVSGTAVSPLMSTAQEHKYKFLKSWFAPICMDTLLMMYGSDDFHTAGADVSVKPDHAGVLILHTSGTTGGTGKPVVLSDRSLNAACSCFIETDGYKALMEDPVSAVTVDLSNAYSLVDQVHLPLSVGGTIAAIPGGILNPWFYKAIPEFGITCLFGVSAMLDMWMKMPEAAAADFTSLQAVVLGGASVSAGDKRRYQEFLSEHGGTDILLINGYGISELGGACCLSSGTDDESIGMLLPGFEMRLYDEEQDVFCGQADAPCEGVLYLRSDFMAEEELDGEKILKTRIIDGEAFICTNDLVRAETDGGLVYLGRANRYFINEDGFKYEAGRVETEISKQSGIESCGMVPVYVKTKHDNIPMLCVKVLEEDKDEAAGVVCRALRNVFGKQGSLGPEQIPHRILIAEDLPRNANGKIDLYRINRGEVSGETFEVQPVRRKGRVVDFRIHPLKEDSSSDMIREVFDGIAGDMQNKYDYNKAKVKKREEKKMMNNNPFGGFGFFNQMGGNMMSQMMDQMMQMYGGCKDKQEGFGSGFFGFPGMSGKPDMQKMMDNMKNVAPFMQQMNQQMNQQMDQMITYVNQMNQMTLQMMQQMQEQNCRMWVQFFQMLQNMNGADVEEAAEEEKPKTSAKSGKSAKAKAKSKAAEEK